jgi:hypothetical protein
MVGRHGARIWGSPEAFSTDRRSGILAEHKVRAVWNTGAQIVSQPYLWPVSLLRSMVPEGPPTLRECIPWFRPACFHRGRGRSTGSNWRSERTDPAPKRNSSSLRY